MMYVIYNNDGSIKYKLLNEFVEQGNNNVNEIFVAIEGRENWTLYASFKLPNGSTTTVVSSTPTTEFIEGLGTFTGRKILLSNAETLIAGALQMNVVCLDEDDTKIVAFNTYITINETGIQLSDPILLTVQEYENLLVELKRKMEYPTKYVQVTTLPDNPSLDTIYVLKGENDLNEFYMFNGKTESWIPLGSNRINLSNYYTKEEGEEFEEEIETRVSSVESQMSSVASGSPAGVYATASALTTADPNHSKIYLVLADNKWYYYDTGTSQWTAGGTYLAGAYDTELDVNSINAVENKVVSKVARKVSTNVYDKEYLIYSWVYNLGPHYNANALGHMAYYTGYTTCNYICVNVGDRLQLTLQSGVSNIKVREYNIGSDGKITSLGNSTTYSADTTITFTKCELIRISVQGDTTPTPLLAQSCVKLYSCRSKEEIFVYPYGKWEYTTSYITAWGTISSPLGEGLNGDPYYDTVAKGSTQQGQDYYFSARPNAFGLSANLNYCYIKYGINQPSLLQTCFWKKNNVCNFKMALCSTSTLKLLTGAFISMNDNESYSLLEHQLVYNGSPSGVATTESYIPTFEMQKQDNTQQVVSTKDEADALFDSFEFKVGFRYKGEKVDLSNKETKNGLIYTYKGTFPFISTQTGGQKPSCMSEYNGKIFVGCDNYGCNIINLEDLSLVATINDTRLEHFNNSEFTDEFYDESDDYPLLLVGNAQRPYNADLGSDYSDYISYVRFVNDLSSFSIVKKIILPTALSGFWANGLALDNENKTLWIMAVKKQSWNIEEENGMILTSWDLSNMTQDNNGNYIPTLKTRCEFPYIRAFQDLTFVNGYIFMLAASQNSGKIPSELYIIDTAKQSIRRTLITITTPFAEMESITKVLDKENNKYYLLIGEALYAQYGGVNGTYGHIYRLDTIDD